MWTERYRPRTIDEVVNQREVVDGIKALLQDPSALPHMLFSGPPGTGKTTVALCVCRQLFGANWRARTLELNSSDERGIGVVRERVKGFAQVSRATLVGGGTGYGVVILDECDEMTHDAQTALRRIMETMVHTCRFILVCNYQSGIIQPIQSRCSVFQFSKLEVVDATKCLSKICEAEGYSADDQTLQNLFSLADGDLRQAVNNLQLAAATANRLGGKKIDTALLSRFAPNVTSEKTREMLSLALQGDFVKARDAMYDLMEKHGASGHDMIRMINRELKRTPEFSGEKQAAIVEVIGDCDFRLTEGANSDIQVSAMLAKLALLRGNKSAST